MPFAIIILVVVILVVGGAGYFGLQGVKPTTSTVTTCYPTTACQSSSSLNDVTLFIPYTVGYGQTYSTVAAGNSVPATVGVTGKETIQTFAVNWAPGVTTTGATGSQSYTYTTPGLYALSATATTPAGVVHTGTGQLVALKVNPSADSIGSGSFPATTATFKNSTGGGYPWIGAGGSVTVNGTYTAPPANPLSVPAAPTLTTPTGAVQSALSEGSDWAQATYTFANAGFYAVTLVVSVNDPGTTAYQNYTWGVYVGATASGLGCALCKVPTAASPHPGTVVYYNIAPGGALTLDPAADYYSVGYEVGQAFDESLITYNGTDTGQTYANFVPEAATCVPGSPLCTSLYGQSMVKGNNYTFALDPAAQFYDPGTGAHRAVYPVDVMYSIIRAIFYTQVETVTGYYVGFDIAGPLVPYAGLSPNDVNASWDLGVGGAPIHYPYNNTPFWTLNSMHINDTAFCPAAAMASDGCITFNAGADGESWAAILQILAIISADGIQASGWYYNQGAEVPGFVCTSADAPCMLPGDVSSTNTTAYRNAVSAMSPTAWDAEEQAGTINYPDPVPAVGFSEVGSGPYYLDYANQGVGYVLHANPYYNAPTGCAGQIGCLPEKGQYVPDVIEYWGSTDTVGIQEVEAGYADTAVFETPHFPLMLSLVQSGSIGLLNIPTLDTDNFGFNLHIDLATLKLYDSNPVINIPDDAFSYEGLRATLTQAYPYATAQSVGNVIDGIDGGNPYGGFLPSSETAFYAAQVPWPNYNNVTQVFSNPTIGSASTPGTAAWYWHEASTAGNPYSDPELEGLTSAAPMYIPVLAFTSAPNIDAQEQAWGNSVNTITGGALVFQLIYVPGTSEIYTYLSPGQVPWTVWWFGWIPDYPAPVNNWQGAYGTGLWGGADALYPTLVDDSYGGDYNDPSCGHTGFTMSNLTYWADQQYQLIPQDCQGTALNVTTYFITEATYTSNVPLAQNLWDLAQAVYNNLQLTIGLEQPNVLFTYAPWINPSSINTNVIFGGGNEWAWYELNGNGIV